MTTKTLTIMEDAYALLKSNKLESESFSEAIRRHFSRKTKKDLTAFFGILSDQQAKTMHKYIIQSRKLNTPSRKELKQAWNS